MLELMRDVLPLVPGIMLGWAAIRRAEAMVTRARSAAAKRTDEK